MNNVREFRLKAGMKQGELARAINVSQPTVCDWERQKNDPRGINLEKLAELFKVSPWAILGFKSYTDNYTQKRARRMDDNDLVFALFGDAENITVDDVEDVKRYAQFIAFKKQKAK